MTNKKSIKRIAVILARLAVKNPFSVAKAVVRHELFNTSIPAGTYCYKKFILVVPEKENFHYDSSLEEFVFDTPEFGREDRFVGIDKSKVIYL